MQNYFKYYNILVLISLSLILGNCGWSAPQKLATSQEFHRGNYDEPDSLDPQKAFAAPDYNILQDLYEGLMTYDQHGAIVLGQAKSYQVSEDKKKYVFTLKDNLFWSNGEKLTAYDFEYGIKRTLDPTVGSQNTNLIKVIRNANSILEGKLSIEQLGIKALNAKQLEIQLDAPIPYLLGLLAHNSFMPVYKPNVERYKERFTAPGKYVTNGPFKLTEWVVNSHLTVTKNKYYQSAENVKLDKVVFYPINQPSVELQRFRAGELDFTAKVPPESLKQVKDKYASELIISPMLAAYYYTFNLTRPPFKDDLALRKALSLAIDKQVIAEKILHSSRMAINSFVPLNTDNYASQQFSENQLESKLTAQEKISLAKRYLSESKFKPSESKIKLLYHTNETNKLIATAIAAMWKKNLNIKVELINQEWKVFLKTRLERKDTEVFREGWIASYNDATSFLDLFLSMNDVALRQQD